MESYDYDTVHARADPYGFDPKLVQIYIPYTTAST